MYLGLDLCVSLNHMSQLQHQPQLTLQAWGNDSDPVTAGCMTNALCNIQAQWCSHMEESGHHVTCCSPHSKSRWPTRALLRLLPVQRLIGKGHPIVQTQGCSFRTHALPPPWSYHSCVTLEPTLNALLNMAPFMSTIILRITYVLQISIIYFNSWIVFHFIP